MDTISNKIQEAFADYAICKDKSAYGLFAGRNLPTFVKDYILNRFSKGEERDEDGELAYMFFIKEDINSKINIMYVTDENYNVKYKMRFRDGEAELSKDGESSYLKNIDNPNAVLVMSKEDGISFYYLKKGNGGSISHYFATKVDSYATNKLLLKVSRNKENIHYKNLK